MDYREVPGYEDTKVIDISAPEGSRNDGGTGKDKVPVKEKESYKIVEKEGELVEVIKGRKDGPSVSDMLVPIDLEAEKSYLLPPAPKCNRCGFKEKCQYFKQNNTCFFHREAAKRVIRYGKDPIYLIVRMIMRQEVLMDTMLENGADARIIQVQQNNSLKAFEILVKFTEDNKKRNETDEVNWARKAEAAARELKKMSPEILKELKNIPGPGNRSADFVSMKNFDPMDPLAHKENKEEDDHPVSPDNI